MQTCMFPVPLKYKIISSMCYEGDLDNESSLSRKRNIFENKRMIKRESYAGSRTRTLECHTKAFQSSS